MIMEHTVLDYVFTGRTVCSLANLSVLASGVVDCLTDVAVVHWRCTTANPSPVIMPLS
jgi:hypothetical protein